MKLSWEFLALFRELSCISKNGENGELFWVIFGFGIEGSVDIVTEGRRHDSLADCAASLALKGINFYEQLCIPSFSDGRI